jgi:hypothetical protein
MDVFHGSVADTGYYMHESVPANAAFLTPIALITGGQAFKDAEAVATGPQQGRVQKAKISIYYVVLLRWDEVFQFAVGTLIAILAGLWHRFGIVLAGLWHRFGRALASFWQGFGRALASFWQGFGQEF